MLGEQVEPRGGWEPAVHGYGRAYGGLTASLPAWDCWSTGVCGDGGGAAAACSQSLRLSALRPILILQSCLVLELSYPFARLRALGSCAVDPMGRSISILKSDALLPGSLRVGPLGLVVSLSPRARQTDRPHIQACIFWASSCSSTRKRLVGVLSQCGLGARGEAKSERQG